MFNTREEMESASLEILDCDSCGIEEALHTEFVSSIGKWVSTCYSDSCWAWLESLTPFVMKNQMELPLA